MFRLFRGILLVVIGIVIGVVILASSLDEADDAAAPTPTQATTETTQPTTSDTTTTTASTATPTTTTQATTPETVPQPQANDPSVVRVQVANATDVAGAAGRLTTELTVAGYIGLPAINAPDELKPLSQSIIYYEPDYLGDANQIANLVGASQSSILPLPVPSPITSDDAHVIIVIGDDNLAQSG